MNFYSFLFYRCFAHLLPAETLQIFLSPADDSSAESTPAGKSPADLNGADTPPSVSDGSKEKKDNLTLTSEGLEPEQKGEAGIQRSDGAKPSSLSEVSQSSGATIGAPLLGVRGISANLFKKLKIKGYSESALNSIGKCGDKTGEIFTFGCSGCADRIFDGTWWCDKIFCKRCSNKRRRRLERKYRPMFNSLTYEKGHREFLHLIISPENVDSPEEISELKIKLKRLMNCKEMQLKVLGYLCSTECTKKIKGKFHIHFHIIIYGSRLNNKVEGYCLNCIYKKIKYDKDAELFYCSSKKCNSINVVKTKDSPLVQLCKKFFKSEVNVYITDKIKVNGKFVKISSNPSLLLSYVLKYVTKGEFSFESEDDLADYLIAIYKKRLISTGGLFYNYKVPEEPVLCWKCNTPLIRK